MIDRVVLSLDIELDIEKFDERGFHKTRYISRPESGAEISRTFYICNLNGVVIKYYVETQKLKVIGRFVKLSELKRVNNRVSNIDKIMEGNLIEGEPIITEYMPPTYTYDYDIDDNLIPVDETFNPIPKEPLIEIIHDIWEEDMDTIINEINMKILNLTKVELDIREFKVLHFDACFNLVTEHFNEYIMIFNSIFKEEGFEKRYTNYALKNGKPLYSSFYIKPNAQYKGNLNGNYTVNFYNKIDQLINHANKKQKYTGEVTHYDLDMAYNILRLEVKGHYLYLNKICEKFGISKANKPFREFLNIDLCSYMVTDMYKRFIDKQGELGFCSYQNAKDKILKANLNNEKVVLEYIEKVAKNNTIKDKRTDSKYRKILAQLGIHHYFIPKEFEIDFLPSPMKLLEKNVKMIKERMSFYEKVVCNGERINVEEYSPETLEELGKIYNIESIINNWK